MGQTLSEPVTEKHSVVGEDDTLAYAVSEMQGWRISMEDAHATILALDDKKGDEKTSFFAVYDGHGGSAVATYAGESLHQCIAETREYKTGDYEGALKRGFLKIDEDMRKNEALQEDTSGCTAVACLLVASPDDQRDPKNPGKTPRKIICANAGDSRCVLSVAGEAEPLSEDHKPQNPGEAKRIRNAGGFIEFNRVNGNLALSRALGDFEFKRQFSMPATEQIVTADPELKIRNIDGEEEFLVIACDGIWDCLSSQQVIDFVRRQIANGKDLKEICEEGMERCLAPDTEIGGVGCDNMTLCVIALLGGRTKEEWYAWVKKRVEENVGHETPDDIAPVFSSSNNSASSAGASAASNRSSVLSALAGGLSGAGGAGGDEEKPGAGGSFTLPDHIVSALGGSGIVFRPGSQTDEEGRMVYEAHVVDQDDDDEDEDDDDDTEMETARVQELDEAGEREAEKRKADGKDEENAEHRPELAHQPEIVESPKTESTGTSSSTAQVEVRPSTEGRSLGELTDKSEDPLKTT